MKVKRVGFAIAVLAALCGGHQVAFAQYQISIIQPAGSVFTIPYGMNDQGVITGFYQQPSGFASGFVRQPNGAIATATPPPFTLQNTLGGVNNAGIAAGSYLDFFGVNHSAAYDTAADTWTPFPDIAGAVGGLAASVNNGNVFTGYSIGGFTMTGSFVGNRGYLYDSGVYSFFDAPGVDLTFEGTIPEDINDSGTVVGFFSPMGRNGLFSGFVRNPSGAYTVLDYPGAESTFIQGVNNQGVAAGSYDVGGMSHSFLWSASAGFTNFDLPFGFNTEIWGIDNRGNLVGTYLDPRGFEAGFLASPVPEPGIGAFALAVSGSVLGLALRRRWRGRP